MTESSLRSIQRFYNSTRRIYNPILHLFFQPGRKATANRIIELGGSVLDMGCHQGQLEKLLPQPISYTGVDISEKSIQKAMGSKKPNSNFIHGEMNLYLNQETRQFDHYCLLYVWSVTPEPEMLIKAISARMKKGQRLFIVNHFSNSWWRHQIHQLIQKAFFPGFNFYFPLDRTFLSEHYTFVNEKKTAFLWTFLELERL